MTMPITVVALGLVLAGTQLPGSPATRSGAPQGPAPGSATQAVAFARVYAADTPGLVLPAVVQEQPSRYTPEAMRARVQGTIVLEVTVGADGHVRDAMVTKSLDTVHGLDDQAVVTASEWVFKPGTLDGRAVPVRTSLTYTFALR